MEETAAFHFSQNKREIGKEDSVPQKVNAPMPKESIAYQLYQEGLITKEHFDVAEQLYERNGGRHGDILLGLGAISEEDFQKFLARRHGLSYIGRSELQQLEVNLQLLQRISYQMARDYLFFPLSLHEEDEVSSERGIYRARILSLAVIGPLSPEVNTQIRQLVQADKIRYALTTRDHLHTYIRYHYLTYLQRDSSGILEQMSPEDQDELTDAASYLRKEGLALPQEKAREEQGVLLENRWQLLSLIAEGGMGLIYRALDLVEQREVAVKLLRTQHQVDQEAVDRLQREAEILEKLRHPHMVYVYHSGFEHGVGFFIVMELLRGCGLDVMIKTSPSGLPLEQIEKVFLAVCTAMDYAHQQGIIHRDLKPENIFIVGGPREVSDVKVLDFGIAKLLEARRSRLTHTGMTLGTPRYLSPEQATGTHVDQRSDIYSLSVILFEALTGKELFQADSPYQYLMKHVYTIPRSLYEAAPERLFPREMDALLQKGLAKRSTDRPTSMSHLMTLLQDAFRSPLQQAPDKKAREQSQAGRYRIGHTRSEHIGHGRDERPLPKREMATPATSLPSASPAYSASPRREAPRLPPPTSNPPKQRPPSYDVIERIPSHAPQMGGDTRLKTDSAEVPWVASPPLGQVSVELPRIASQAPPVESPFEATGFIGKASVELPRIGKASVELPKIGQKRPQEISQQPSSLLDTPTALTSTPSLLHRPPRKRGLSIEELPRITKEKKEGRIPPQALLTNRDHEASPPSRAIFELTTGATSSPLPVETPKPDRRQLWLGLSFGALFTMLLLFILFFVLRPR